MRLHRNRLNPFKILVLLYHGDYSFVTWKSANRVHIKPGQFARMIRISAGRMRNHLHWLEDHLYISDLTHDHGWAEFTIKLPPDRTKDIDF